MRFLLVTLVLIFTSHLSLGQSEMDSLLTIWKDQSKEDTIRLDAINKICSPSYLFSNPDSAFFYANISYNFARKKDLPKEKATALYLMGVASMHLATYRKAIGFQKRSIEISDKTNDTKRVTRSLNSLGNVYLKMSDYANAIDCYRRCLILLEKEGNKKGIAILSNNIGLVYYDLEDYEKALEYMNLALSIYQEFGNEEGQANTLINIGSVFRLKKEYKQALEFYNQGLNLKKKNNVKHGLATCYSNIGLIHQAYGERKEAKNYFNQSMKLHQEVGNKKGIARCLIYFAAIYQKTNLDSTIHFANEALSIAQRTENNEEILDASELLYKANNAKGNYKLAFEIHQLYQETKDSIFGARNLKAVLKNEFQYNEDKRILHDQIKLEKQLGETQLKIQRQRFAFLGGFVLFIFGLGIFLKRRYDRNLAIRKDLLYKIELLKEKLSIQSVANSQKRKELVLNKAKIEKAIHTTIGESSWKILNLIFKNPSISNKEIAAEVSLSLEGVSSSLRRMYSAFDIKSSSNKKITLIMEATRLSFED